jgi:hypothetical protein
LIQSGRFRIQRRAAHNLLRKTAGRIKNRALLQLLNLANRVSRYGLMPSREAVLLMIANSWISPALSVAAQLSIPDLLEDGPKSIGELARASGTQEDSLYRVLRALTTVGVFAELEDRRFSLTPLADSLRTRSPGSVRDVAIWQGQEWHWRPLGNLLQSVKTGATPFDELFGTSLYDYLGRNPEARKIFSNAMASLGRQVHAPVPSTYDFSAFRDLVDVGGGQGNLLASILKTYPTLRGVLFDRPVVVEEARQLLAEEGLAHRCEVVGGDFFEALPSGADAYLLASVLHNWPDDCAISILRNCQVAMTKSSKLLAVELVLPGPGDSHFGKLLDLDIMVVYAGRERTELEYRSLFAAAGFRITRIVEMISSVSIIEAIPDRA